MSTSNAMGSSTNFTIETIAPTPTESGGSASSGSSADGSAVETGNAGVKDVSQLSMDSTFWLLFAFLGFLVGA
jgi:hypothetical protein